MNALLRLAGRNLLRHRRRTVLLSLTGALGVTALLLVAGLSTGFLTWLIETSVLAKVGAIQVHRIGYAKSAMATPLSLAFADAPQLRAKILSVPGVTAVSGRLLFSGLVGSPRGQTNFVGRGVEPAVEVKVCPKAFDEFLEGASMPEGSVVVGGALLKAIGLEPGERVQLQSTSAGGRVNALTLTLLAMNDAGAVLDSRRQVALPLPTAQQLTGLEGRVTEYGIATGSLDEVDAVAVRLRAELGPEYEVQTWGEVLGIWRDVISYMNWLIGFAGLLLGAVVVTLLGAATSGAVYERVREIGTQLAVGMRRRDVQRLFLYEAALLGVVGAIAGVVLGVLAISILGAVGIPGRYFGFQSGVVRPSVDWLVAGLGALGTVGATVIAGLVPAWRASRLNPVDALRGKL
ncbi:MAG: hypothetical protein H6Q89_2273 [Myxococcaceae bacterium]|nr:hypothetical protein [Myxococcaceae bacterium]